MPCGSCIEMMECDCPLIWFHWLKLHRRARGEGETITSEEVKWNWCFRVWGGHLYGLKRTLYLGERSDSCSLIRLSLTLSGLWNISGPQKEKDDTIWAYSRVQLRLKWSKITNGCTKVHKSSSGEHRLHNSPTNDNILNMVWRTLLWRMMRPSRHQTWTCLPLVTVSSRYSLSFSHFAKVWRNFINYVYYR